MAKAQRRTPAADHPRADPFMRTTVELIAVDEHHSSISVAFGDSSMPGQNGRLRRSLACIVLLSTSLTCIWVATLFVFISIDSGRISPILVVLGAALTAVVLLYAAGQITVD